MSQVPPLAWLYNVDLFDNVITRDVFLNKCFTVNYAVFFFLYCILRQEREELSTLMGKQFIGGQRQGFMVTSVSTVEDVMILNLHHYQTRTL